MVAEGKHHFWVHQLLEYLVGLAMIFSGLQSPTPVVPCVVGSLVVLNGAVVDGPLGAFRGVGRGLHRVLDWLMVVVGVGSVFWPGVEIGTRVVHFGIVALYAVVVWRTDYSAKLRRKDRTATASTASAPSGPSDSADPTGGRGEQMGRTAGRAAAKGIRFVRRKSAERR